VEADERWSNVFRPSNSALSNYIGGVPSDGDIGGIEGGKGICDFMGCLLNPMQFKHLVTVNLIFHRMNDRYFTAGTDGMIENR